MPDLLHLFQVNVLAKSTQQRIAGQNANRDEDQRKRQELIDQL